MGLTEDEAQGAIYYPYAFRIGDSVFVAVRTSLPPESLALTLQKVVRQIDANVPVDDVRSMDTRIADSLVARRSPALLAGLFSGIAVASFSHNSAFALVNAKMGQRHKQAVPKRSPTVLRGSALSSLFKRTSKFKTRSYNIAL